MVSEVLQVVEVRDISPWFVNDLPEDSDSVVVTHVLKVDVVHLKIQEREY